MIDPDKLKEIESLRADMAAGYGSATPRVYADHVGLLLEERQKLLAELAAIKEDLRVANALADYPEG